MAGIKIPAIFAKRRPLTAGYCCSELISHVAHFGRAAIQFPDQLYADPGNRFWRAIHEAGITRRYQPGEFASPIDFAIGFTDLSKTGASTKFSSAPILMA